MLSLAVCCYTFVLVLANDELLKESLSLLGNANNKLTAEFLYNGVTKFRGVNFVTSVYPLLEAAGQLSRYSKGMTRRKFLSITGLKNMKQIRAVYPVYTKMYYNESITASPDYNLKVYTDDDNEFCPAFERSYKNIFNGDTGVVDYSNPKEAAREINDYVKQGRRGFKDIFCSKKLENKNGYNFISTLDLYYKFDDRFVFTESKVIKFKYGNKVKNIPGALGTGIVKYAYVKSIDAQTVQVQGKGGDYIFLIVLPKQPDGLMRVLDKFRDPDFFQNVLSQGREVCAKAIVTNKEITELVNLGASLRQIPYYQDLSQPGKPEFDGISKSCDNGYIASMLHEVHFTPTALNSTKKDPCSKYDIEFETNHPHVYYIMTAKSKSNVVQSAIAGIVQQS